MTLVASTYWGGLPFNFKQEPERSTVRHLQIPTADHRFVTGLWWTRADLPVPAAAAVLMHPRVDFSRHYVIPRLLEAGYGVLAANSRTPNNDLTTVHEEIVLDLGGCIDVLKSRLGVEQVVLIGNSGGGSLSALYQSQASRPAADRIAATPGGRPTALPGVEMEPADALILISCHKGQGMVMNECIDPSVVDESDPHRTDADLDMYAARNGFRPPPEWCDYDDEFVTRYREAQLARVRRLDERAHELIADATRASERIADPSFSALGFDEQHALQRREAHEPIMTVYRTMANLHYVDRHLDPSHRTYGSLLSDRPDLMNQQIMGFGRLCTPHAWLSTWSGLSSNANMLVTLPEIRVPTLVVHAGRDREIYPVTDAAPIFEAVGAEDRTFLEFGEARHYFEPDFGATEAPDVEALMDELVPWLAERVPAT